MVGLLQVVEAGFGSAGVIRRKRPPIVLPVAAFTGQLSVFLVRGDTHTHALCLLVSQKSLINVLPPLYRGKPRRKTGGIQKHRDSKQLMDPNEKEAGII